MISNLKRGIATHEQQVRAANLIEQLQAKIEELEVEPERIARIIVSIKWIGPWIKRMLLIELYPLPPKDKP